MSFKIIDISSEKKLQLSNVASRDLNKRFGKRGDLLELQVYTLSNELLSTIRLNHTNYKLVNKDKDNLSTEIKIDFQKLLISNGFTSGKYKLKLNVLRPKIFGRNTLFDLKEISTSRKELRVIANRVNNEGFDLGVSNYISERDSAPYFKDFI